MSPKCCNTSLFISCFTEMPAGFKADRSGRILSARGRRIVASTYSIGRFSYFTTVLFCGMYQFCNRLPCIREVCCAMQFTQYIRHWNGLNSYKINMMLKNIYVFVASRFVNKYMLPYARLTIRHKTAVRMSLEAKCPIPHVNASIIPPYGIYVR